MKAEEMIQALRKGKKFTHKDFKNAAHIFLNENQLLVDNSGNKIGITFSNFADDCNWEIYEEKLKFTEEQITYLLNNIQKIETNEMINFINSLPKQN